MNKQTSAYLPPGPIARAVNNLFGRLVGLGFGLPHNYLLQVRGRKTGMTYSTPVNVLSRQNKVFLVAARGRTQWVRNALAANELTLKKGRVRLQFQLRVVPDEEKPELLKNYLDKFKLTVQKFFPVPAGSPAEAFVPMVDRYPVFELIPRR